MYMYWNGEIVSADEIKISPFDHGYLYGMGVFETFRVYERHPFLFDDHYERLKQGLQQLNITNQMEKDALLQGLYRLLDANQIKDAYVRLNISAGVGDVGLRTEPYDQPTVLMYMRPLPKDMTYPEKDGQILRLRRNTPEGSFRLKSHHYLNNMMAKREIGSKLNVEGIFLTETGVLAEGIVSNLFWIRDGIVYTPSVDTGILNGITRQFLLEMCQKLSIIVKEGHFSKQEMKLADEAFITNSIQEIVSLKSIDGRVLPEDKPLTSMLQAYYYQNRTTLWTRQQFQK